MDIDRIRNLHVLASAIMWAGLLLACALVLSGTPYFGQLLPILGGGAVFFVVILPAGLYGTAKRPPKQ